MGHLPRMHGIHGDFIFTLPLRKREDLGKVQLKYLQSELRKADRTVGYITVHPNRTVSLSEFSFFKLAFAFAEQNPPGFGTFDLSVGPF